MSEKDTHWVQRVVNSYALYVALGVVVGVIAAPFLAAGTGPTEPQTEGTVAIIPVEGTIDGESAAQVTAMLAEARQDPSVKAVVLVSNSGGGGAAASEELYFSVKRTEAKMPVVASVDAGAASGAYYTIAPSDHIYVKPSSTVGSIGVLAQLPQDVEPNDIIGTTGPNKLSGSDSREFLYILESLQRAFVRAVFEQRGDALQLSRAQVEQARVYSGGQAVNNGLADGIGDRTAAVQRAAEMAELDDYAVRVLRPDNQSVRFVSRSNYLASSAEKKRMLSANYLLANDTGGPTFLMVSGLYLSGGTNRTVSANAVVEARESDATDAGVADGTTTGTATNSTADSTTTPNGSMAIGPVADRRGGRP